jgi:hypothetical protein
MVCLSAWWLAMKAMRCRRGCSAGALKSQSASCADARRMRPAAQVHLGQRVAAVDALLGRGVEGEDHARPSGEMSKLVASGSVRVSS